MKRSDAVAGLAYLGALFPAQLPDATRDAWAMTLIDLEWLTRPMLVRACRHFSLNTGGRIYIKDLVECCRAMRIQMSGHTPQLAEQRWAPKGVRSVHAAFIVAMEWRGRDFEDPDTLATVGRRIKELVNSDEYLKPLFEKMTETKARR